MKTLPNHTCPLCGGPNACVPAQTGSFDQACWCAQTKVSAAALASVPEALRNRACLCARCASQSASVTNMPSSSEG